MEYSNGTGKREDEWPSLLKSTLREESPPHWDHHFVASWRKAWLTSFWVTLPSWGICNATKKWRFCYGMDWPFWWWDWEVPVIPMSNTIDIQCFQLKRETQWWACLLGTAIYPLIFAFYYFPPVVDTPAIQHTTVTSHVTPTSLCDHSLTLPHPCLPHY